MASSHRKLNDPFLIISDPGPRLAIAVILLGDDVNGWVCHFGLKCSSWTTMNAGTSGRTACTPLGNLFYRSVQEGNCLASRIFGSIHLEFQE